MRPPAVGPENEASSGTFLERVLDYQTCATRKFRRLEWTRSQPIRTAGELALEFAVRETQPPFAYQRIAREAVGLHSLGMSAIAIARVLKVTDKTVAKAIACAGSNT